MHSSKDLINICKLLYDRGYITPTAGNVSYRNSQDSIIITPSRVRKYQLRKGQLCKLKLDGKTLTPNKKHSSEYRVHCKVYKERPDIKAIIHAHPKYSTICSLVGISLERSILPETAISLGSVPTIPFETPGTEKLVKSLTPFLPNHNALILQRHGVITFGSDLWQAFDRLEELEFAANIAFKLSLKGRIPFLRKKQKENLLRVLTK